MEPFSFDSSLGHRTQWQIKFMSMRGVQGWSLRTKCRSSIQFPAWFWPLRARMHAHTRTQARTNARTHEPLQQRSIPSVVIVAIDSVSTFAFMRYAPRTAAFIRDVGRHPERGVREHSTFQPIVQQQSVNSSTQSTVCRWSANTQ